MRGSRHSKRKTITEGNRKGVIGQLGKELGEFRPSKPREGEPQGVTVLGAADQHLQCWKLGTDSRTLPLGRY